MRKFLIAATALSGLLAFAGSASAADLAVPVDPAYDWSGFYVGLHAGYGWGDSEVDSPLAIAGATHDHNIEGFVGGVHGGYNFQTDSLVFGLEGDFDFSDIDGDSSCSNPLFTCSTDVDWLASVRGRFGFAFDNTLLYATGGVAFADIEFANAGPSNGQVSDTEVGFVVGGGVEYAFSDALSVRAEGLYYDFGSGGNFLYPNDGAVVYEGNVDFIVARAGVTFHF